MEPTDKTSALRRRHALNPKPQTVHDPAFAEGNPFFDAQDLVQVKYEMLRRVRQEGQRVSQASGTFGFSRPSFYQAQAAFEESGLPGLVPQRPGPRRAHKLSDQVLATLESELALDPTLTSSSLAGVVRERFGVTVHPRSVERALRRRKRGLQERA